MSAPILVLHAFQRAGTVSRSVKAKDRSWAVPGAAPTRTILGDQPAQLGGRLSGAAQGVLEVRHLSRAPQHPAQHRSQRPILLAVDQELGEGPSKTR
jgi:hypothetical protein